MSTVSQRQLGLLDVGAPAPSRCGRCDAKRGPGGRCRTCDKGEIPEPGKPAHRRWTRGIGRVIRRRLEERGIGHLDLDAYRAIVLGDVVLPDPCRALLADLAALPCSAAKYRRLLDRAVLQAQAYHALRKLGWPGDHSPATDRAAFEIADEILAARAAREAGVRIVVHERARIADVDDHAERDHDAELEAQQAIDAVLRERRMQAPGDGPGKETTT